MDANLEVRKAQRQWARSMGIWFDSSGYVRDIQDNLWQPLSPHAHRCFARGAGSELRGHMRALHSSSALAANLFDYWTERDDKSPLLAALGVDAKGETSLDFEARFPTGLGGTPPHLDVAMRRSTGFVVAVEAKFTEHLKRSTRGKTTFTETYFPKSGKLWAEKGLPSCQALAEDLRAEELHGGRQRFEYLDPRQLLKHALGLAAQPDTRFSLYYLYYDWHGERPAIHRREIDLFDSHVGDEIGFKALAYQEVYRELRASGQVSSEYLDYLGTRYFPRTND